MITINSIDSVSIDGGEPNSLTATIRATSRTTTVQAWQTALDAWNQTLNVARDERIAEARAEEQAAKAAALESAEAAKTEALAAKDAELAAKDTAHTEALAALTAEKDAVIAGKDTELAAKDADKESALAALTAEKDAIIAAKQAEIDALTPEPVPDGVTVRTPLQILGMLTPTEYGTIWTAAQQSPEVSLWFDMLRAASEVRSDDARTIGGIQAMVGLGFLTAERAAEIFGVTL